MLGLAKRDYLKQPMLLDLMVPRSKAVDMQQTEDQDIRIVIALEENQSLKMGMTKELKEKGEKEKKNQKMSSLKNALKDAVSVVIIVKSQWVASPALLVRVTKMLKEVKKLIFQNRKGMIVGRTTDPISQEIIQKV